MASTNNPKSSLGTEVLNDQILKVAAQGLNHAGNEHGLAPMPWAVWAVGVRN